jgi:hypothetical protein
MKGIIAASTLVASVAATALLPRQSELRRFMKQMSAEAQIN